jgi:hypothetical protein
MAGKRDEKRDVPPANLGWLKQLADEVNVPFPPEGEGWATMTQICEAANRDHQVMRKILRDKKAETRKFRTATADGKTVVTMHYRIVQK